MLLTAISSINYADILYLQTFNVNSDNYSIRVTLVNWIKGLRGGDGSVLGDVRYHYFPSTDIHYIVQVLLKYIVCKMKRYI